jgi:hypothetical protein
VHLDFLAFGLALRLGDFNVTGLDEVLESEPLEVFAWIALTALLVNPSRAGTPAMRDVDGVELGGIGV